MKAYFGNITVSKIHFQNCQEIRKTLCLPFGGMGTQIARYE